MASEALCPVTPPSSENRKCWSPLSFPMCRTPCQEYVTYGVPFHVHTHPIKFPAFPPRSGKETGLETGCFDSPGKQVPWLPPPPVLQDDVKVQGGLYPHSKSHRAPKWQSRKQAVCRRVPALTTQPKSVLHGAWTLCWGISALTRDTVFSSGREIAAITSMPVCCARVPSAHCSETVQTQQALEFPQHPAK